MSLYSLKVNEPKTIVKMFIPAGLIAKLNASLLKTGRIYYFFKSDRVVLKFDRGNKRQADHEDSEKNDGARTLPKFKMVYWYKFKKKKKKKKWFETGTRMD